jgi:hypothetical protein
MDEFLKKYILPSDVQDHGAVLLDGISMWFLK